MGSNPTSSADFLGFSVRLGSMLLRPCLSKNTPIRSRQLGGFAKVVLVLAGDAVGGPFSAEVNEGECMAKIVFFIHA